jgi:hypothetical protein
MHKDQKEQAESGIAGDAPPIGGAPLNLDDSQCEA